MGKKEIVDSHLFIRLDLTPAPYFNQAFASNQLNKAHLASQLLLYDTIVIPTTDFGILPALISWFGLDTFKQAIRSSAIKFIRRNSIRHLAKVSVG